ncbi:MAG: dienelactone hydrolase family protein [Novosphingobium sp.]
MSDFVSVELTHAGVTLTGQAALPAGQGPFPAVMVMHNALGIGDHVRDVARRLAALGYVAVASDMYGGGASTGDPAINGASYEAVMKDPALLRGRVVAWFDRVSGMPQVRADRVAAIGYCFGGACVLELARSGVAARAVVSYHGVLSSAQPMQPGGFAGEVHAWCGAQDPYAPLAQIEGLRAEMASAGVRHTITTFGQAAHGFTDPGADAMGREGIAYNELADRLSWAGTVELLEAVLKE